MSGEETAKSLPFMSGAFQLSTFAAGNSGAGPEVIASTSDGECICLRVIPSDFTNVVHFRIKANTALGRLKRYFSSKLDIEEESRFLFDKHRITNDDTPKGLNMMNGDVIEVYQEKAGGM